MKLLYISLARNTHLLPWMYTHSFGMGLMRRFCWRKRNINLQSNDILSSIHSIDSMPTFILIKAQTATSNNIRRSAKNKFGPGFSFSHVWKTGGSLQTADLISGKWNVYKSFWPGSIILVSFITISAFPSPILSQQQLRHTRGKIRGVSRISKRENSLVYKRRRMGGTGLD
jgi:hypothetical protein